MPSDTRYPSGTWVRLHGLCNSPQLNGMFAQVFDSNSSSESGRIPVSLHGELIFQQQRCYLNSIVGSIIRYFVDLPFVRVNGVPQNAVEAGCKLLKPENLQAVPHEEMAVVVLYACRGELEEGAEQFHELSLPSAHPLFSQSPNCPIPEKLGTDLIQTKLMIRPQGKLKVLQESNMEREWCTNQSALFLRSNMETGLAPRGEADFVGPVVVCRPNGLSWTAKQAKKLHLYFNHLMEKCYGHESFDPQTTINEAHFKKFTSNMDSLGYASPALRCFIPVLIYPPAINDHLLPLIKAAYHGNIPAFDMALEAVNYSSMPDVDLAGANHFGTTLAQAAAFGGSGEIMAAILTHERLDAETFEKATDMKSIWQFALRACSNGTSGDDFELRKWVSAICFLMKNGRRLLGARNYVVDQQARGAFHQGDACALPQRGEFKLNCFDWRIKLDYSVSIQYPFPRKELELWLKTTDYKSIFSIFGDGEFAALHCDLVMLERMYILACDICRSDIGMDYCAELEEDSEDPRKPALRKAFRNIGWHLFFRASKDCMIVHEQCFEKAISLSPIPGRQAKLEIAAQPKVCWNFVGTWVN